jgi:hypothetical protein
MPNLPFHYAIDDLQWAASGQQHRARGYLDIVVHPFVSGPAPSSVGSTTIAAASAWWSILAWRPVRSESGPPI